MARHYHSSNWTLIHITSAYKLYIFEPWPSVFGSRNTRCVRLSSLQLPYFSASDTKAVYSSIHVILMKSYSFFVPHPGNTKVTISFFCIIQVRVPFMLRRNHSNCASVWQESNSISWQTEILLVEVSSNAVDMEENRSGRVCSQSSKGNQHIQNNTFSWVYSLATKSRVFGRNPRKNND